MRNRLFLIETFLNITKIRWFFNDKGKRFAFEVKGFYNLIRWRFEGITIIGSRWKTDDQVLEKTATKNDMLEVSDKFNFLALFSIEVIQMIWIFT